ncbi:MAG: hypothetical protein J3R72DRAFT_478036 [Linnemannia gamsii]|nr:MAG: hypothetical protein J3R72DRAFT_478036 [Linnemannia gamsii]
MVYATRSRSTAQTRTTAPSARAMGDPKPTPKKKRASSSSTRRRQSVTKGTPAHATKKESSAVKDESDKVPQDGKVLMSIDIMDSHHGAHVRDGREHHLEEQDGTDRHHIFFKDFDNTHSYSEETMNVDGNGDVYTLRDGHQVHHGVLSSGDATAAVGHNAPAAQPRQHRASTTARRTSTSSPHTVAATGPAPLVIHVGQSHRKHSLDGKDHHIIEADGRDHHHIHYGDFESSPAHHARRRSSASGGSAEASSSHKVAKKSAHSTAAASSHHAVSHDASGSTTNSTAAKRRGPEIHSVTGKDTGTSSSRKNTTHSRVPMHQVGSSVVTHDGQGHKATTRHYEGTDSTTTTTTTTTTSSSASAGYQEEHHRPRTRDAAALRLITQKTELDRSKARDAILSLDSDVIQLQKLLQEKEDALRAAEALTRDVQNTTTVRTETLTKEVRELEVMIRDLREGLKERAKALKEKEKELKGVKEADHEEIKAVEGYSEKVHEDLEAAQKQRDLLAKQVKAMTKTLRDRESDMKAVQLSFRVLEKTNAAQSKTAHKLSSELSGLKKGMQEKEKELKECHAQIKHLEGEHHKVLTLVAQLKGLRARLEDKEGALRGLEKENKTLTKDHLKTQQNLTGEVQSLTQEIYEAEGMLRNAQAAVDGLVGFRDRAATLEVEVHDLRDQVNIHEKHETDLEDALMTHENCAFESQQLQGAVNLLQARLNEKQSEIQKLQASNTTLHQHDQSRIAQLQSEMTALSAEMAAHDQAAIKLKEKADKDIAKINSTAGTLRIEILALRQQVRDKTADLKQHDKSHAQTLGQAQTQNSELTREIKKLERLIDTKDRHAAELDIVIANMSKHAERADQLEGEMVKLQRDSKKAADRSAKDLDALTDSSFQLSLQIDTLKNQLSEKEAELKAADKIAVDLTAASEKLKSSLLTKISTLETTSSQTLTRAQKAEASTKSLRSDIKTLENRLSSLQNQLEGKEELLKETVMKADKDHEEGVHRLEEMRELVAGLRKEIKDVENETRVQIKGKEDVIAGLRKQLASLEKHEAAKISELTMEIEKETALLHKKEALIHDVQKNLTEQTHEIGRLNTIVSQTRNELSSDRKRRASEIQDSLTQYNTTKGALEHQIADLESVKQHLEEKAQNEHHQHEVHELELAKQVKDLLAWEENAVALARDRDAEMALLQAEKDQQTERASAFERQALDLQHQLQATSTARTAAVEQCTKLSATITKLEKELVFLKGVIVQHDKDEANMQAHLSSLQGQVQSLQSARTMMQRDLEMKEGVIEELEDKLKMKASEGKKALAAKDKIMLGLHARITDLDQTTTHLQSSLEKSEESLLKSQHALTSKSNLLTAAQSQITSLTNTATESATLITTLRQQTISLQQELTTMELKMQHEISTAKELTEMLAQLRKSMKRDSEAELKKLDQLEMEIGKRNANVEEMAQVSSTTRTRMDSGAFLEHTETTTNTAAAAATAIPSTAGAFTSGASTTTAH